MCEKKTLNRRKTIQRRSVAVNYCNSFFLLIPESSLQKEDARACVCVCVTRTCVEASPPLSRRTTEATTQLVCVLVRKLGALFGRGCERTSSPRCATSAKQHLVTDTDATARRRRPIHTRTHTHTRSEAETVSSHAYKTNTFNTLHEANKQQLIRSTRTSDSFFLLTVTT